MLLATLQPVVTSPRRVVVATAAAVGALLVTGIPTAMIDNSWFTRMTPITWWSYPVWILSAILVGLLAATYVGIPQAGGVKSAAGGGLLTTLAVGCPTCNKLVVMALGTSGALTIWAPLQPLLALASLVLLVWVLRRRLQPVSCPLPEIDGHRSIATRT